MRFRTYLILALLMPIMTIGLDVIFALKIHWWIHLLAVLPALAVLFTFLILWIYEKTS